MSATTKPACALTEAAPPAFGADVVAAAEAEDEAADEAELAEAEAELAEDDRLDMRELLALAELELTLADDADADEEAEEPVAVVELTVVVAAPVVAALPVVAAPPSHVPTQVAPDTAKLVEKLMLSGLESSMISMS